MVVEQAARRALQDAAIQAQHSLSEGMDAADVRSGLQLALHSSPEAAGEESSVPFIKSVTRAVDAAARAYQGEQGFLKLGVPALDDVLRGLGPGDFMLLGGATSMGKTSLALEIAGKVAIDQRKKVGFWSLEMTDDQLAARMASARARVPYADLRDAHQMQEKDFRAWVEASQAISDAPLRTVPKHIRDLAAGHAALRRVKREFGNVLDLVIVDYAQLVRGMGKSRFEQMTEVSIGLKAMAGMLGCPLIGLVQLSRSIGERDDKRPQLSDIKETGQFENDADQVVFCHREGYWMERQGPKADRGGNITDDAKLQFEADLRSVQNVMEIIVRKNRHGRLATAQVGFHAPENRFWRLGQHDDVQEGF
jgi:replicative DNA helicase